MGLTKGELEYLKEDNEWHLVLLDIADLIRNSSRFEVERSAARAISFVLNHQERKAAQLNGGGEETDNG